VLAYDRLLMRRRAAIAAASLALTLGACGGGDEPPAPATRSLAPSATRTATPAAPPARRVRFRASDGKPVTGVYRPAGAAAPAVVLVNGLVGGAEQWDAFARHLHESGFATLAYDGRGGVDEAELVKELGGAVAFLSRRRDVDARRLGIVGSSVGASTAVLAMTGPDRQRLRAAVALSPPAAPVFDALMEKHRYRPRNVLFVSDHREQSSVKSLTRGAIGSRTAVSEMIGHGVALLENETNRRVVIDWLERHLK
jgi:dipeptidyl aminopeptidase/acylaminoacyl peptidase